MANIQEEILETFLAQLEKADDFSKERVDKLRKVFVSGRKTKPEDLVKILSEEPKEQLT
jgi:hypothetical protein